MEYSINVSQKHVLQNKFNFLQCEQGIVYLYTGIEVLHCNKHSKVFFSLCSINLNGCGTSV